MSDPKNPNEFDDLDGEATMMSPISGADLANMLPPPPAGYQQQPRMTPPPPSAPQHPANQSNFHQFQQPVAPAAPAAPAAPVQPYQPPAPPPNRHDSSAPFVPQPKSVQHGPPPGTSSEETKLLDANDIHSEQTVMHSSIGTPLIPIAKIVIVEGIQKGKEYPLVGEEVSFGREKDNTISYPDLSVSRHHFKIHQKKDKFVLEDLGSGNGTLLNNKKVKGTSPLKHNDNIQVGKSVIQFRMLNATDSVQQKSGGGGSKMLIVVLLLLLVGGGGAGAYFFLNMERKNAPKPLSKSEMAMIELRKGLALRQKSKWLEARLAFQQAKRLDPNNLEAAQLLEDTKAEIHLAHKLRRAKFLVDQGTKEGFQNAKKVLVTLENNLPPGSSNAPKVWSLLTTVNKKLAKYAPKPVAPRIEPPKKEAPWGFKRRWQCRRKCRGRGMRCRRFGRRIKGRYLRRYLCVRRGTRRAPPPPRIRVRRTRVAKRVTGSAGDTLYRAGNWRKAAAAFGKANATEKKAQVERFGKIYYRSLSAYRSYNPRLAIPVLRQALRLDLMIGEGKSVFTKNLRKMLANMYFSKGLLLMGRQDFARAFGQFRNALRHKPKHRNTLQKLNELRGKARQLLGQGKALNASNPNQAKKFFRKVLRITLPSAPEHKQARQFLQ